MSRSRIYGWGACVPELVVTNDDLAAIIGTSDEWVRKRSGIAQRRYATDGEGSTVLAARAAADAMETASVAADDIDLLLCCTLSPDIDFPSNASLLQERMGMAGKPAFDLRNQCSGFVYALAVADLYIRTGGARKVLVVGSEIHSSGLDYEGSRGRDVTVLFGDGAGAVVVGASEEPGLGLLSFKLHADGGFADSLWCEGPSCRRKPRLETAVAPPQSNYVYPSMNGRHVFKHAVERMSEVVGEVTEDAGVTVDDIDMLLPHQANLRINQLVALGLGIGEERVANNIERYGNTTAATIPILLTEVMEQERIEREDLVCMVAFGAGFTWGAALYRW